MNVVLRVAKTKQDKQIVKNIITKYHSYVPTYKSVGRRIDWLIIKDECVVGMIGIGSATYPPCKDVLQYLGYTKDDYRKKFNTIANNWRFCVTEQIPNLGTQVLKLLRQNAPVEWRKIYRNDLFYLMTFVGGGKSGSVYKADNWELIGKTAGLPSHKSSSMKWHTKNELKTLFVKPDGKNKKLIFIKEIKQQRETPCNPD